MWRVCLLAIMVLTGCRGAAGAQALDIGLNLALAASVAASRHAAGECYVDCAFGTYCDTSSGTCEALPCHGTCGDDEVCDQSGPIEGCIPAQMSVAQTVNGPPPPRFSAPTPTTPEVQPSRDDVPAASPSHTRALQP